MFCSRYESWLAVLSCVGGQGGVLSQEGIWSGSKPLTWPIEHRNQGWNIQLRVRVTGQPDETVWEGGVTVHSTRSM